MDPLDAPAARPGRSFKGVACGGNIAALGCRKEVQVLGGAGGQVLGQQCRSPG
jgi:hypothetical protein